ncbi:MAG: MgtC/SapB family protein [bacterium]|nr:MgtC/SapB family protein [bacterium]
MVDTVELIARLATAGGLGALLGIEREISFKVAGLRTHTIVALGAALFTVSGAYGVFSDELDPSRVAAQVVTGIGFIGAGAILRSGLTVTGLTTAGTLWLAAAVGVTAGMGLLLLSLVATAMGLLVLVLVSVAKPVIMRPRTQRVEVSYYTGHGTLGPLMTSINEAGGEVRGLHLEEAEEGLRRITANVSGLREEELSRAIAPIAHRDEVVIVSPAHTT